MADDVLLNQQVQQALDVRVTDLEAVNFGNLKTGAKGLVELFAELKQDVIDSKAEITEIQQSVAANTARNHGVLIGLALTAFIVATALITQYAQLLR